MRFSDIPGHDDVKQRLRTLVDTDRVPHALLLEGPPGVGKFMLARAFAQYIHCTNRSSDGEPCGKCPACQQHEAFNHIDTIFSFPVVKKGSVGLSDDYIEEFRDMMAQRPFMDFEGWQSRLDNVNAQPHIYVEEASELVRRLNISSHGSRYKIVLMWLPERLNIEAANKLLKLIEEPTDDTLFVFTSDNSRLILPTIYSRTQRIAVNRYDDAEVAQYLVAKGMSAADADAIARLSMGNISSALALTDTSKDSRVFLDFFIELMRKAYTRKVGDLKQWSADVAALGRERHMKFLEYCARMIRENFILNIQQPALVYLNEAEMNFSRNFSPFIHAGNSEALFDVINDACIDIAANANAKLVNFDLAVKVILLLK